MPYIVAVVNQVTSHRFWCLFNLDNKISVEKVAEFLRPRHTKRVFEGHFSTVNYDMRQKHAWCV